MGSSTGSTYLVSRLGLEPRTPALKGQCSTVELPARHISILLMFQAIGNRTSAFGQTALQYTRCGCILSLRRKEWPW